MSFDTTRVPEEIVNVLETETDEPVNMAVLLAAVIVIGRSAIEMVIELDVAAK
jgi:hypothetical protein